MYDWYQAALFVLLALNAIFSLITTIFVVRLLELTSSKVTRMASLAEDLKREADGQLTNSRNA